MHNVIPVLGWGSFFKWHSVGYIRKKYNISFWHQLHTGNFFTLDWLILSSLIKVIDHNGLRQSPKKKMKCPFLLYRVWKSRKKHWQPLLKKPKLWNSFGEVLFYWKHSAAHNLGCQNWDKHLQSGKKKREVKNGEEEVSGQDEEGKEKRITDFLFLTQLWKILYEVPLTNWSEWLL